MELFAYNSINTEMFKKYYFITSSLKENEIIDQREDIIGEVKIVKFTKEENKELGSATYNFYVAHFPNYDQTFPILVYQHKYIEESVFFNKIVSTQAIEDYIVKIATRKLQKYCK